MKKLTCRLNCENSRNALTLLELLIVLVILAALTGIAVKSLQPVSEQLRYEATQQTLINIDEALVTRSLTPDRVANYSGFVTDMGRLPVAIGSDAETQLSELWSQGGSPTFGIASFDDPDTTDVETIPVAAGWRGPYLLLPPGPNVLRDGYGRAFEVVNTAAATAASGDEIGNLVSAGANGSIDALDVNYDRDLELPGGIFTTGRYQGSINVSIKESDGVSDPGLSAGETLRVHLYGPLDGAPAVLDEKVGAAAVSAGAVSFDELITDQVVGPRVLVAYVTTGTAPTLTVVRRSAAKQIVLAPGMNPAVQLNLQ